MLVKEFGYFHLIQKKMSIFTI